MNKPNPRSARLGPFLNAIVMTSLLLSGSVAKCWGQDSGAEATPKPAAVAPPNEQPAEEKPIEYWVEQLAHDHYLRREMASKKVVEAGPAAVAALASAIRSGDLEVVERATQAMVEIAIANPPQSDGGVYDRLNELASTTVGSPVSVARSAVREIRAYRYGQARQVLTAAGMIIGFKEIAIGSLPSQKTVLQIDEQWNGETESLQWLAWLDRIDAARVIGPAVTSEVMKYVVQMPELRSLVLVDGKLDNPTLKALAEIERIDTLDLRYIDVTDKQTDLIVAIPIRISLDLMGTNISDAKAEEMRSELPGLKIEHRRGAFMGVKCYDDSDPCQITSIQRNSAAEAAGLIPGDIIVQIDEVEVKYFRDLRSKVNRHLPGDEVEVRYRRGERIESTKLRLRKYEE